MAEQMVELTGTEAQVEYATKVRAKAVADFDRDQAAQVEQIRALVGDEAAAIAEAAIAESRALALAHESAAWWLDVVGVLGLGVNPKISKTVLAPIFAARATIRAMAGK